MAYTSERIVHVYDDKDGSFVYVGPDADSLDLVELRYVSSLGQITDRIMLSREQALLVSDAIRDLYA